MRTYKMISGKSKRLIYLIEKLNSGTALSSKVIIELIEEEFDETVNLRAAQRYLADIKNNVSYAIEKSDDKRQKWLTVPTNLRSLPTNVSTSFKGENYILSLNVLKAHLRAFTNTSIEKDVNKLIDKINKESKSDLDFVSSDSLYWDQNYGQFDYSAEEKYSTTINRIISLLAKPTWIKVEYERSGGGYNKFECLFREFFNYSGTLYIATFVPKYKHHVALAIQFINSINNISEDKNAKLNKQPIPNFSFEEFTNDRFGVFHGKVETVLLAIDNNLKKYFINRKFHQSQVVFNEDNPDEDLNIRMNVPISPELIAWILSWGGGIKVKSPQELKDKVVEKAKNMIV